MCIVDYKRVGMVPMPLKMRVIQQQVVMAVFDNLGVACGLEAHCRYNPRQCHTCQNQQRRNCSKGGHQPA